MINQINIITDATHAVEGYDNVSVTDVQHITNGYVQHITCNILDQVDFSGRNQLFVELLRKLCPKGEIVVKFFNLSLLPNKILSGDITGQKFSDMLPSLQSCWSETDFTQLVSQLKGYAITKLFHDMTYTVVTIQKT